MATKEDFDLLVGQVTKRFDLASGKLHEHIVSVFVPASKQEICRLVFSEKEQEIGISFQFEVIPTDVVQVWSACRHFFLETKLHEVFYTNSKGETFHGLDAQIMCENDRESKYLLVLEARTKAQREEDSQLMQLEKSGKVTFH